MLETVPFALLFVGLCTQTVLSVVARRHDAFQCNALLVYLPAACFEAYIAAVAIAEYRKRSMARAFYVASLQNQVVLFLLQTCAPKPVEETVLWLGLGLAISAASVATTCRIDYTRLERRGDVYADDIAVN